MKYYGPSWERQVQQPIDWLWAWYWATRERADSLRGIRRIVAEAVLTVSAIILILGGR
jgi:hypothetical protein